MKHILSSKEGTEVPPGNIGEANIAEITSERISTTAISLHVEERVVHPILCVNGSILIVSLYVLQCLQIVCVFQHDHMITLAQAFKGLEIIINVIINVYSDTTSMCELRKPFALLLFMCKGSCKKGHSTLS
jgi:hypothetical protein